MPGLDRSPRREISNFSSTVQFSPSSDNHLKVTINKKNLESRISKTSKLYLLPKKNIFELSFPEGKMEAVEKQRRVTGLGSTRLVEISTSFERSGNKLNFQLLQFSDGYFEHGKVFTLSKQ